MKPTSFEIPQGCTRVTIEQHEDKLVTIFELKEPEDKVEPINEKFVNISANCMGVEFKEDKPEARFKDGDILEFEIENIVDTYVGIYKDKEFYHFNMIKNHPDRDLTNYKFCTEKNHRHSPESLPIIQDALAKVGKVWNAEKKCIEELKPDRWRAEGGQIYYFIEKFFEIDIHTERFDRIDNRLYESGNYFQTEQQAKDFAERIKQLPR